MTRPIERDIARAIREAQEKGRAPLAVLDIDLTLVENAPRTRRIWRLWLESLVDRWPGAEAALAQVDTMPIVFGVRENLAALGVTDEALGKEGFRFWLDKFFDDGLCRLDEALPDAVAAVQALYDAGVTLAYLTARPAWMREGTVETLSRLGFPMCIPRTVLVLKPDTTVSDTTYKEAAMGWLASLGVVIVAADNEPAHCNSMRAAFERARVLHVNTRHSGGAPPLESGVDVVASLAEGVLAPGGSP